MNVRKSLYAVLAIAFACMVLAVFGSAYAEGWDVVIIEVEPTPTPYFPELTPPPTPTPKPEVIITNYQNDPKNVDIAARSAYWSPFDKLYWKFVLWSTQFNRTLCSATVDGVRRYSPIYTEVATDTDEYTTWDARIPNSKRGLEILHYNAVAADLFFDYIRSVQECGSAPMVPWDGVLLEYIKDENGMNRSANVYNLDGKQLTIMSQKEFSETIEKEFNRRIGN